MNTDSPRTKTLHMPLWLFLLLAMLLRLALAGLPLLLQARVDGAPISGRAAALIPAILLVMLTVEVLVARRLSKEEGVLCEDCAAADDPDSAADDPPGR